MTHGDRNVRTRNRLTATTTLVALIGSVLVAGVAPALAAAPPTVRFVDPDPNADPGTPDIAKAENASTPNNFTFHLERTPTEGALTVNVFAAAGSAASGSACTTSGTDYLVPQTNSATFDPGVARTTYSVQVCGDSIPEGNETFTANIGDPSSSGDYVIDEQGRVAVGTILNDDGPKLTFATATVTGKEGAAGTTKAVTVTINATDWASGANRIPASVGYRTLPLDTQDDPKRATPDEDYVVASGRIDLSPPSSGTTSTHELTVTILGDDLYEGTTPEEFRVELFDPQFARFDPIGATPRATVKIEDDEAPPVVTVDDAAVVEGDADTSPADVVVRLSHPSAFETVVNYATGDGTATNSPGNDYVPVPSGTQLKIPPLATSATIEAHAKGDTVEEPNETFKVNLSKPASPKFTFPGGTSTSSITSTVSIRNDDGPYVSFARAPSQPTSTPRLEFGDLALPEGSEGQTTSYSFKITLPEAVDQEVTVAYATQDGTATTAQNDYTAASGSVKIPAGKTTAEVTVTGNGDPHPGPTEWFFLDVTSVSPESAATILDERARGMLVNDDGPQISVADVKVTEGTGTGTTKADLTLNIDTAYTEAFPGCDTLACDVTVRYRTVDGTATSEGGQADYAAIEGTLTIPEGQTSAKLSLTVNRDAVPEANETFVVELSEPSFAVLGPGAPATKNVTVTIVNDEGPKVTVANDVTVTEGHDGTRDATFTVKLEKASTDAIEVGFSTADGTAKASDDDYIARAGTVKILPGQLSATVPVKVIGDRRFEGNETFSLNLGNPHFGVLGTKKAGTATITNDDTNSAPVAVAGPDLTGTAGKAVAFDGSGSSDPNGDALSYAWAFGDSGTATGATPTHTYASPGTYTATLTVTDPHGAKASDSLVVTVSAAPSGGGGGGGDGGFGSGETVGRSSGDDRIETAVDVSADHWTSATDVVLATAYNYPDALAGGTLAAELDAPLLLTAKDALPGAVSTELARLKAERVWILGGPDAVSQAVEDALKGDGLDVRRVAGDGRFTTAAAVAAEVGASPTQEVALTLGVHDVEGRSWPDALSAGSLAAGPDRLPILLTTADTLPAATEKALADLGTKRVLIIGGPGAIAKPVADRLVALGYEVERLAGADRYATSVAVAEAALKRTSASNVPVVFATGGDYPDGLAAAALAARLEGIVVLVNGKDAQLYPGVDAFLRGSRTRLTRGVVVGGPAVVTETIRAKLVTAMGG